MLPEFFFVQQAIRSAGYKVTLVIEVAGPDDFLQMLELNESCVPHVNRIGGVEMAYFHERAHQFKKVVENRELAGFVIALTAGETYASLNYQWFCHELDNFLYIDRIMVHADFRRRGIASLLYQHLEQIAVDEQLHSLCCEVNLLPPNPDSLALHRQLGFVQHGTQKTEGGTKEVSLLVKTLEGGKIR